MKLVESALSILEETVARDFNGNLREAARFFDIPYQTIYAWLKSKTRVPSLRSMEPVLEKLGVSFTVPGRESGRPVCFVDAEIVPAGQDVPPPDAQDYWAAPLVGEVGAGPGYIPQEKIESWFLVYKYQPAVMRRRNLLAVQIGPTSTSMEPVLHPGDIVLVDRDDRNVLTPGRMMLVLDPQDGSGMIKRVSVEDKRNGDYQITYYSDNAADNPPRVLSLMDDFDGDWRKCIVGRVIWSWSDVSQK